MHFVNYRIGKLTAQVPIASPIKIIINDNALGRPNDSVIAEKKMPGEGARIRVYQSSVGIESLTLLGIKRTVCLKVIKLPRLNTWHERAPDIPPAILLWRKSNHFRRLWIIRMVVQQNPHRSSRTTKDKKLHAHVVH